MIRRIGIRHITPPPTNLFSKPKKGGPTIPKPSIDTTNITPETSKQSIPTQHNNSSQQVKQMKILNKMPKIFQKYITRFVSAPISHATSFLILHELSAVVPLVGLWYGFYNWDWNIPFLNSGDYVMEKSIAVVERVMAASNMEDYSPADKARLIMDGVKAYAITKMLFPFRVIFSLWSMPWFARVFVVPFTNLFKLKKK